MKYLDLIGLSEVWANIKSYISSKIPTKTSQLQNDSNYVTTSQLPSKTSQLTNDSDFTTNAKLTSKANDSDVVHKSGNETINGVKNFNDVVLGEQSGVIRIGNNGEGALFCNLYYDGGIYNNIKLFYPKTDNEYNLGTSTNKWANVYANRISFPSDYYITTDTNDNSLRIIRDGTGHGNNFKVIIQGDTGKFFAPNGFIGNLQGNADTATSANDPNAVHKTNTDYTFRNYGLNSLNIDEKYNENYVVGISEDGYGTRPIGGWTNIINFCTYHFLTQLCIPIDVNKDTDCMYIRTRWANNTTWGEWRKSANDNSVVHKSGDEVINGDKTFSNLLQARYRLTVYDNTNLHNFVDINKGWIEMSNPNYCYIDFKHEGTQDYLGRIGLNPANILYLETVNSAPIMANGKNIVRSVNGVNADNNGNVSIQNSSLPIGSYIQFAGSQAPSGFLVCNGGAISRTTYANLFAVIGTTYGSGDGSTTFNLPNLTDRFLQGSTRIGTVKYAGLPNITGELRLRPETESGSGGDGAFYNASFLHEADGIATNSVSFGNVGQRTVGFKASNSNSIYGNSSTVQPPALTCLICIKY